MTAKPTAIVQARMTSTRLPGKIFRDLGGKPVLARVIDRLRRTQSIGSICIATTTNDTDNVVASFARENDLDCHRGSEQDVLARFHGAAHQTGAETIVRVTSDCPLIDPTIIDRVVRAFNTEAADYASNTVTRTYPIGMDTEVFTRAALDRAFIETDRPEEREHVTPYFYRNPQLFKIFDVPAPPDQTDQFLRLTLDTPEDFALISRIYSDLSPAGEIPSLQEILEYLCINPELRAVNDHIPHNWLKPASP